MLHIVEKYILVIHKNVTQRPLPQFSTGCCLTVKYITINSRTIAIDQYKNIIVISFISGISRTTYECFRIQKKLEIYHRTINIETENKCFYFCMTVNLKYAGMSLQVGTDVTFYSAQENTLVIWSHDWVLRGVMWACSDRQL